MLGLSTNNADSSVRVYTWRTACNRVRAEQSSIGIAAFHDLANDIPRARAPFNDASRTQG
jgi:hypothetical protein